MMEAAEVTDEQHDDHLSVLLNAEEDEPQGVWLFYKAMLGEIAFLCYFLVGFCSSLCVCQV